MRHVLLVIAAALSVLAVGATMLSLPSWVGPLAIAGASVALVTWLVLQYRLRSGPDLALSDDQRDIIANMKREGNTETAVRQVQLWKRDATRADAMRIVDDL